MVVDKWVLNVKVKEIVRALYQHCGHMSPNEISKKTGIAYLTVRKYVEILAEKYIIILEKYPDSVKTERQKDNTEFKRRSETKRYSINPELLEEKRRAKG